ASLSLHRLPRRRARRSACRSREPAHDNLKAPVGNLALLKPTPSKGFPPVLAKADPVTLHPPVIQSFPELTGFSPSKSLEEGILDLPVLDLVNELPLHLPFIPSPTVNLDREPVRRVQDVMDLLKSFSLPFGECGIPQWLAVEEF